VATARNVVSASAEIFKTTLDQLEAQLRQDEEQRLARETLKTSPLSSHGTDAPAPVTSSSSVAPTIVDAAHPTPKIPPKEATDE
jgi:hypothetical protein